MGWERNGATKKEFFLSPSGPHFPQGQSSEYAKFAGHVHRSLINVWHRGLISAVILFSESKSRKMSGEWITSEKFDIRQTFHSQMSGNNSECPAMEWKFAGRD